MADKQYPNPGTGPVYTGEILQTGPNAYLISIGTEGSEIPPFRGKFVDTGPFTSRKGIAEWIEDETKRLLKRTGTVTVHVNNAAIFVADLEQIIGKEGVTLDLQSGKFLQHSETPKQLRQ